jgi:hypothetical protein
MRFPIGLIEFVPKLLNLLQRRLILNQTGGSGGRAHALEFATLVLGEDVFVVARQPPQEVGALGAA